MLTKKIIKPFRVLSKFQIYWRFSRLVNKLYSLTPFTGFLSGYSITQSLLCWVTASFSVELDRSPKTFSGCIVSSHDSWKNRLKRFFKILRQIVKRSRFRNLPRLLVDFVAGALPHENLAFQSPTGFFPPMFVFSNQLLLRFLWISERLRPLSFNSSSQASQSTARGGGFNKHGTWYNLLFWAVWFLFWKDRCGLAWYFLALTFLVQCLA